MVSGSFKYLSFFVSHLVSVHKTNLKLAEDVYFRQAGNLMVPKLENIGIEDLEKHEVVVEGFSRVKAQKDLVVHGLGWVSVSGLGESVF